ncbi:MAG: hypothetical protein ABUS48_05190 [Pseudomonadota bacterium]
MNLRALLFAIAALCVAAPAHAQARTELTKAFLEGQGELSALAPMSAFAPGADARLPSHTFRGVLHFDLTVTGFQSRRDLFHYADNSELHVRQPPPFDMELVQVGEDLVPALRGPVFSGHPQWDISVEPGRIWNEPGDGGLTRAALPFALIETVANCTHNGVLTFLFDETGIVSRVAWEIASETCAYHQFDAWGVSTASFQPTASHADAVIAAYTAERAQRMPAKPFAELARDHAGVDISAFAAPADIHPDALTTFGVIANGVHYLGGCETRAGPYPFCETLDVPSYSLAKSLVGALGLMRLEQLHPGATRELIAAHAPACSAWRDVTFLNALDMATGRYGSPEDQADENAMTASPFFVTTQHASKIDLACTMFPRHEAPGRRWVYHTTDTYALGTAMADYWRAHHGANADFFTDVLADGVYAPLRLGPTIRATRRTLDAAAQPLTGWGLTLQRDDIAKLGQYLVARDRPPLVSNALLDAALQRDPHDIGLQAGDPTLRYNHGFWAYNAQGALHCSTPVWIPFLSGFGGIIVALMPNGVVYYYVSDGGDYRWARAVRAANTIAPLCPGGAP